MSRLRTLKRSGWPAARRKAPSGAQVFADVCGLPVEVPEGEEIGALGAAMCAAVATGHYPDLVFAAQAMCRVERTAKPRAHLRDFYDERYGDFFAWIAGWRAFSTRWPNTEV